MLVICYVGRLLHQAASGMGYAKQQNLVLKLPGAKADTALDTCICRLAAYHAFDVLSCAQPLIAVVCTLSLLPKLHFCMLSCPLEHCSCLVKV